MKGHVNEYDRKNKIESDKLIVEGYSYFNYFRKRFNNKNDEYTYDDYYDCYIDALMKCAKAYVKKDNEFKEKYNFQYVLVGYYRGYLYAMKKNRRNRHEKEISRQGFDLEEILELAEDNIEFSYEMADDLESLRLYIKELEDGI